MEYVGTLVKHLGHDVLLVDLHVDRKNINYYLKKYQPDVVLFTSYLIHVNIIKQYSDQVKQYNKNTVTAVGGVQTEVTPELFEYENIDYILGINGMKNVEILLGALENHETPKFEHEQINKNYMLPVVDRSLTDRYRKKYYYSYRVPCALLKTSFGCPYQCNFCYCTRITNYEYYVRELEPVMEEIMALKEDSVFIVDDNFLVDKERIKAFCDLLDKYNIHKNFYYSARADYIANNEDVIELLANHGFDTVFVGLESFKQEDLDNFNKKSDVETSEKAANILQKHNVELHASAIVGRDWDKEDFKNFSKWLHTIKYRYINFMSICPLPGTPIYNGLKNDLMFKEDEYEKFDFVHVMLKPTKLKTSQYYLEILKIYFRVTANLDNLFYIVKTCNWKVGVKTVYGIMRMILAYIWYSFYYGVRGD
jgi:radical SAM superfamily enzyme YgiQ (UPF0313 family)